MVRYWTEKELAFLQDHYDKMRHAEIGESLNRSTEGVRNKCYELGLNKRDDWWSEEEEKLLRKEVLGKSIKQLLLLFPNRSEESLRKKIFKTGIRLKSIRMEKLRKSISALTEGELGYIAGLVDGEGTITITSHAQDKRTRPNQFFLCPSVSIVSTRTEPLEWIKSKIPQVGLYRTQRRGTRRDKYSIYVGGYFVSPILEAMKPYLHIKQKHAGLVIKYVNSRLDHPRADYTKDELKIWKKVEELNKKGGKRR